jgi:hypothetical protein
MSYVLFYRPTVSTATEISAFIVLMGILVLSSLSGNSNKTQGQCDNCSIRYISNELVKGTMKAANIKGLVAGLIYTESSPNARVMSPEILSGTWHLQVINGRVSSFDAKFDQIAISGNLIHKVKIVNFTEADRETQTTNNDASSTGFRGTTDVVFDDKPMKNVTTEILINNLKVIEMHLYIDAPDPFRGKPITGIIN